MKRKAIRELRAEQERDQYGKLVDALVDVPIQDIFEYDLKCPICRGTIHNTRTVAVCLHRFCSECIETALRENHGRFSKHLCPCCRVEMASRRDAKHDENIDQLKNLFIDSIKVAANGPANTMTNSLNNIVSPTFSGNDLKMAKATHKEKTAQIKAISIERRKSQLQADIQVKESSTVQALPKIVLPRQTVRFSLLPYPKWKETLEAEKYSLSNPYLKARFEARMSDICAYIASASQFGLNETEQVELLMEKGQKTITLEPSLLLKDAVIRNWDCQTELRIYFRVTSSETISSGNQ